MNGKMMRLVMLCAVGILLAGTVTTVSAEEGFPLRAKFPSVKHLTTEELAGKYQDMIIVDVRSKIEYDVIHISKAVHVPMSTAMFTKDLAKVRQPSAATPIAFYCNGHTCAKSYEAADQAAQAGFTNVFAYDAGVYDWVKAHPDKGALMGVTPAPVDKLISKDALHRRMVAFDEFKKRTAGLNTVLIDVRDPFQRKTIPQLAGIRNIPLDRLAGLLQKGEFKGKELLIMDAVGKQVQWIQYYLEKYGYADYVFLANGVDGK